MPRHEEHVNGAGDGANSRLAGAAAHHPSSTHHVPPTLIREVAVQLLGDPNKALSKTHELRYGTHGSLSVKLRTGTWYDHENGVGGGILDLIERETGAKGAARWSQLAELTGWKPEPKANGKGKGKGKPDAAKVVATYDYTDAAGVVQYQVVRYHHPKRFSQRRPHPDKPGRWLNNMTGVAPVPYRLPAVVTAIGRGDTIVIVEGEKDADNLAKLGIEASCNHGGAGKWRSELTPHFKGGNVVLVGDNDQAGRDHVNDVGAKLTGTAKSIRVLDIAKLWTECPLKGDMSDWMAAGATYETILAAIEEAPAWEAPAPVETGAPTEQQGDFLLVRERTDGRSPGVYWLDPDADTEAEEPEDEWRWVCSRLEPLARSRGHENRNYRTRLDAAGGAALR